MQNRTDGMSGVNTLVEQGFEYIEKLRTHSQDEQFQDSLDQVKATILLLQGDCDLRQQLINNQREFIEMLLHFVPREYKNGPQS